MIPTFVYIMAAMIVTAIGLGVVDAMIVARNEVLRRRVAIQRAHLATRYTASARTR